MTKVTRKGIGLVEILVGSALLATLTTAVFLAMRTGIQNGARASGRQKASLLAARALDDLLITRRATPPGEGSRVLELGPGHRGTLTLERTSASLTRVTLEIQPVVPQASSAPLVVVRYITNPQDESEAY